MGNIGKYSAESLATYEKIMDGMKAYIPNKVYKNGKYNIYYFINTHGYMHILKHCKMKTDGKIHYYTIADFLLTKDNMLRFTVCNGKYGSVQDVINELEKMIA